MTQDILQQIKAIKQGLLNKAFLVIIVHPEFQYYFRDSDEESFNSFCLRSYKALEKIEESAPMMQGELIAQPIDEKYYKSHEEYLQKIEERVMIARNMIQTDYEPPLFDDVDSLLNHLYLMWHLYDKEDFLALSIEGMYLDLSLAKLLSAAYRRIAADLTRAEWSEKTTKGTKKSRRKNLEPEIEAIKGIFNGLVIPPQTPLYTVAKMIKAHGRTEHLDTIKKYMMSDPEIRKFFKKRGRFWVYENETTSYEDWKV